MPRGRKKTVLEVEIPDETPDETPEITAEEAAAEAVLEEVRQDSHKPPLAWVYSIDPNTGEQRYAGKFAAALITEEWLGRRYGGPKKLRVIFKKPDARGSYVYASQQTYDIDESVKADSAIVHDGPVPTREGGEGVAFGSKDSFIEKMLLMQMDSNAKLMAAITSAFSNIGRPAPSTDNGLLLTIVNGMINKKDPTEIATSLLGVMRESNPGGGGKGPIEMLKELLELQQLLPSSGEQDPTTQWIGKGIDAIRTLAENTRGAPRALPATAPAAVPAAPAPVAPPATLPAAPVAPALPQREIDPNMRAWKKLVVQNFRLLTSATFMPPNAAALTAKANMEADGVWADLVADVRADYPALAVDAELPDDFGQAFIARALKDFPMAGVDANTREWMTATLEELAVLAVTPEEEAGDEGETGLTTDGA